MLPWIKFDKQLQGWPFFKKIPKCPLKTRKGNELIKDHKGNRRQSRTGKNGAKSRDLSQRKIGWKELCSANRNRWGSRLQWEKLEKKRYASGRNAGQRDRKEVTACAASQSGRQSRAPHHRLVEADHISCNDLPPVRLKVICKWPLNWFESVWSRSIFNWFVAADFNSK